MQVIKYLPSEFEIQFVVKKRYTLKYMLGLLLHVQLTVKADFHNIFSFQICVLFVNILVYYTSLTALLSIGFENKERSKNIPKPIDKRKNV